MIGFNFIPSDILTPGQFAEFDSSRAGSGVAALPHTSLIVAQMLSTGSATAGQPILVRNGASAEILFGRNSIGHKMVAAYKDVDPMTQLWVIPLADQSGGTAATGSITVAGTATEAGEQNLYIGGVRVSVPVTKDMTAAQFETAALAALALNNDLPVTCSGDAGTGVDFTARHKGTVGNTIYLGVSLAPGEKNVAGFTFTPTAMSGGASDPDHATAVTAMSEDQYNTVINGCSASAEVTKLINKLETSWGPMSSIEGQLFYSVADTQANLSTLGLAKNSLTATLVGVEKSAYTPMPCEIAARFAAVDATQAQVDPSRAIGGLPLKCNAAPRGSRFTRAECNTLLSNGVSTVRAASDGRMNVFRAVTTYQTNGQNIPDRSFMDLFTVRNLAATRYSLRVRMGTKFNRWKLADNGNEIPGQPILTPNIARNEILAWYYELCTQKGWAENFKTFKDLLIVERDSSDPNRINAMVPNDLINNFLVGAYQISFQR